MIGENNFLLCSLHLPLLLTPQELFKPYWCLWTYSNCQRSTRSSWVLIFAHHSFGHPLVKLGICEPRISQCWTVLETVQALRKRQVKQRQKRPCKFIIYHQNTNMQFDSMLVWTWEEKVILIFSLSSYLWGYICNKILWMSFIPFYIYLNKSLESNKHHLGKKSYLKTIRIAAYGAIRMNIKKVW